MLPWSPGVTLLSLRSRSLRPVLSGARVVPAVVEFPCALFVRGDAVLVPELPVVPELVDVPVVVPVVELPVDALPELPVPVVVDVLERVPDVLLPLVPVALFEELVSPLAVSVIEVPIVRLSALVVPVVPRVFSLLVGSVELGGTSMPATLLWAGVVVVSSAADCAGLDS